MGRVSERRQGRAANVATPSFTNRRVVLAGWLIGWFSVLAINGMITALDVWLLGIPLPVALDLIPALLNFSPNIGPLRSRSCACSMS